MTIEEARKDLLKTLESIDKNKLSLPDLRIYADVLKVASEIQVKTYSEAFADIMTSTAFNAPVFKATTVADMK